MAQLEHIYSLINAKKLEGHLDLYRKAGFEVTSQTVRHPPGLRNGFVYIGCEYIEFEWVENRAAYTKGKKAYHDVFRKHPAPFGFGFEESNIEAFHTRLVRDGLKIPKLYSRGPRDAKEGDAPWWTFQDLPAKFLPGVFPFVLRYETRDYAKVRKAYSGPNKIFAISGVTFVSKTPEKDALAWQKILAPHTEVESLAENGSRLTVGPHVLQWLTPLGYEQRYGMSPVMPDSGKYASLRKTALLHLLSDQLGETERVLSSAGRTVKRLRVEGSEVLYVPPFKADGYAFLIHKGSRAAWKKDRARLGQKVIFKHLN